MGAPACLVLDEPFSGLDPLNVRLVGDLAAEARGRGAGVLLSAHQLHLVTEMCDDVVMLAGGRVVLAGAVQAVAATAKDLEAAFTEHAAAGAAR
jgi:ABC-2 type transport system ATP-binding protein